MIDMSMVDWSTVANIVLGIATVVLGGKWLLTVKVLKEVKEAVDITADITADGEITPDEYKRGFKEYKDVVDAVRELIHK